MLSISRYWEDNMHDIITHPNWMRELLGWGDKVQITIPKATQINDQISQTTKLVYLQKLKIALKALHSHSPSNNAIYIRIVSN